jgi:vacuolar-type H+-ATPase subunit H
MAQSSENLDVDAAITAVLRAEQEARLDVEQCAERTQRLVAAAREETVRIRDHTDRRIQHLRVSAATAADERIAALAVHHATVHRLLDDETQGREALRAAVERLAVVLTEPEGE